MQGRLNAIVDKKSGKIIVQTPLPPFNCLAFEGGGVACAGHMGAIKVMEKYGVLDEAENVSGISGGALAALAVCLGYTAEEMINTMANLPMDKFMERSESWSFTPTFFSNMRKFVSVWASRYFALSSGTVFEDWLKQIVKEKMGDENATFGDLERKRQDELREHGKTRLKKLYIGGTNLSLGIPEVKVLSAETDPDMPLAKGALISALYPFVFSPHKYKGHLWGDGGIKSILLTKIFDDKRFLPAGYGCTEKLVNPGVLAIKVDTYDEIMQIIWGVHKEVKINKTTDYAWQVANATAHNTDINEIREARNTIPLADADVDRLDLYIPPETTMKLIDEAIDTTKEYFENHIGAAYQVTTYKDIRQWLESLSIDEISKIRHKYKEMLQALLADKEEAEARDKLQEFDPARPKISELEQQIEFLKKYIPLALKKQKKPDLEIIYPEFHINIPPDPPKGRWHDELKKEMEDRLEVVKKEITTAEEQYAKYLRDLVCVLEYVEGQNTEPFHGFHDEKVYLAASYYECLSKLREERDSLICKLNLKEPTTKNYSLHDSVRYGKLFDKISTLLNDESISSTLKVVVSPTLPVFAYDTNKSNGLDFHLDLRISVDRRIYLLGGMLYLDKRKCIDKNKFTEIFNDFFGVGNELPANAQELQMMLGVEGAELQLAMFKLEGLLHYFERSEYPTYKPTMDLDVMFGLSTISFFAKPRQGNGQEIEMQAIIPAVGMK